MGIILDTGPLFASLDRRDRRHAAVRDLITRAEEQLIIPSPVLVEVDYMLRRWLHRAVQIQFLQDIADGAFEVEELVLDDYRRAAQVCSTYSDSDVGLVDASIVAVAERLGERKVATFDYRHFRMFRPRHVDAFELLPI